VASSTPTPTRVLGFDFDVLELAGAVQRIVDLVDERRRGGPPALVVTLNPERVMLARRERDYAAIVGTAALVTPDGIGLVRALRRRGVTGVQRVTGADITEAYAARAAVLGHRVALAGGRPGVARDAAAALTRRHPGLQVVAADAGDPDQALAGRLREAAPDIVLVAFGGGREERFLAAHLPATGAAVGMTVGGTLDFLAGRARRAPSLVQRAGLEWAWRLGSEPWRWRRQLVLPRFWWLERREAGR
jgi:N-acetylglucosaminyldiphosphoundecaprenol N-acetyl-beta-D-mannosaminyltransferase